MHKRGNIAFNLLPVIALVLCGMALFSFMALNTRIEQPSQQLATMTSDLGIMQQYIESSAKIIVSDSVAGGFSKEAIQAAAEKHNLHLVGQGNFFSQIADGLFTIEKINNGVRLTVPGVVIQSKQDGNLATRTMTLVLEADASGEFTKFINK